MRSHEGVHELLNGETVLVSGGSTSKITSGTITPVRAAAVDNLPDLLKRAEHLVTHEDKRGSNDVKGVHRLAAYMKLGDRTVPVKFTVKEYNRPEPSMGGQTMKLYHVEEMEVG